MRKTKHHWQNYFTQISDITTPIAEQTELRYFSHGHINQTGQFFCVANQQELPNYHFIEENNPPIIYQTLEHRTSPVIFLNTQSDYLVGWPDGTIRNFNERFAMNNFISVTNQFENYIEIFMFSFDHENPIEHFATNCELFQNFTYYYKDQAQDIINQCLNNLNCDFQYEDKEQVNET